MIAGCGLSCAAIAAAAPGLMPELALGMAGPLVSAVVSWHVIERTHAAAPERLTNVLIASFGIKLLSFAIYVGVMMAGLGLRPRPFVMSFTGYYVALHVLEAALLKRRLAAATPR